MKESDIFVILTDCQFEKNGYQNRFRYQDKWNTMSVNKGLERIRDKRYVNHEKDWQSISTTHRLSDFDTCITESLWETNTNIIERIKNFLEIDCLIVVDTHLGEIKQTGTKRLVEICKRLNATTYISGCSGRIYLNEELFDIEVKYQDKTESKSIIDETRRMGKTWL